MPTLKHFLSIPAWFLGAYIFLFVASHYGHVNQSNYIVMSANILLQKLSVGNKSALNKVAIIQNMKRIPKPILLKPHTLFNSLFSEREFDTTTNKLLGNTIERLKDELSTIKLGPVHLLKADLSNANLFKTDLHNANLSDANLSKANLHRANLNYTNLSGADLSRANLIGTNL